MQEMTASQARSAFPSLQDAAAGHEPTVITRRRGPSAVLLSDEDLRAILSSYSFSTEVFREGNAVSVWLNELAICLMEIGELAQSRARLREALALEPENTKVISNLGILSMKTGDRDEALGFFRTVLEIEPEDRIAVRYIQELSEKI